jgi:hypothetical protein
MFEAARGFVFPTLVTLPYLSQAVSCHMNDLLMDVCLGVGSLHHRLTASRTSKTYVVDRLIYAWQAFSADMLKL